MRPRMCRCGSPREFIGDEGRCHRCGWLTRPVGVEASTWELSLAIAEIMFGKRRLTGKTGSRNDPE